MNVHRYNINDKLLYLLFSIYTPLKRYRIGKLIKDKGSKLNNLFSKLNLHNGFINDDFDDNDLIRNYEVVDRWENLQNKSIKSMTWFIPAFINTHAGMNNILYFIRYLLDRNIDINIVLLESKIGASYCHYLLSRNKEYSWLKKANIYENPPIGCLPYSDAGVATRCDTAYSLLKYNNTKSKFYFLQDDERLLYPEKGKQDLAERTYHFRFIGIATASCLKQMYIDEFGGKAESYFTALSMKRPYTLTLKKQINRLFFYARPEPNNTRNGFLVGIEALREIRRRHSNLEIVTAGSDTKFDDRGLGIKQLGYIPLEKLRDFYLSCDVGIYILLSRHTGVIPFELMATSVAVLTNRQPYSQDYLKHGENCILFDLTPLSIADAFDALYENIDHYNTIISNGYKYVSQMPSLKDEMDRIYQFMIT